MFKNLLLPVLFILSFSITANAQDADPNMGIIPAPVSVKKTTGEFVLSQQTVLLADSTNNKAVTYFAGYLQNKLMLHNELKVNSTEAIANSIVFTEKGTESLPDQGYRLTITPQ